MTYLKEAFDVVTFDQAKHVVLSSDPNNPAKFANETQFLIDSIKQVVKIDEDDLVIDFGCGMGRISKELVHQFKARVVGIDISDSMITFAKLYVSQPSKFTVIKELSELPTENVKLIVSAFVLQHAEDPKTAIKELCSRLMPGGYFVLLNENVRLVPSGVDDQGYVIWKDDGIDVFAEVEKYLTKAAAIKYMKTDCDIVFYKKTTEE